MDRTFCEIAGALGTPLIIDNATQNCVFGHYAQVLVDMDLSRQIFHEIMVEREGFSFIAEVGYEWLPEFCSHCKNISHSVANCRWLHPVQNRNVEKHKVQGVNKSKKLELPPKTLHQGWKSKDNPHGIGSSRAFEAPVIQKAASAVQAAG